ncbi:MAG: hypothetical protein R2710_09825 [Acidimicrobiales bacterium]
MTTSSPPTRRVRRQLRAEQRMQAQEQRWRQQRFAVPHRVDGPKVTLGVAWFLGLLAATTLTPKLVAIFVLPAAAIAALQTAHAWEREASIDRQLAAGLTVVVAATGLFDSALWWGWGWSSPRWPSRRTRAQRSPDAVRSRCSSPSSLFAVPSRWGWLPAR